MIRPVAGTFRDIWMIPDLRKRIGITLALLAVFRIGSYLPIPGIDIDRLRQWFDFLANQGPLGKMLGVVNLFVGGAMRRATVCALGVMPYITASIIFQLLVAVIPSLERLAKEGEYGRRKITQYTRYATVALCLVQGAMLASWLQSQTYQGHTIVIEPSFSFLVTAVLSITVGTMFLMWLGELITDIGVGNGISLIIMCGIISRMPGALYNLLLNATWEPWSGGGGKVGVLKMLILAVLAVLITMGVVFITQAQRRIPMQQARVARGRRIYGGQRTYLPLRVNQAGVIPIIFAQSFMMLPGWIASTTGIRSFQSLTNPSGTLYIILYVALIIFFSFFYTAIIFNPVEMADNLKEHGSFVPGIRPGRRTAEYLEKVMTRITLPGSVFLAVIAILPQILSESMGVNRYVTSFMGGTGILIVVGVALDLVQRIEAHLMMRHYEGFVRGVRIRGRI